MLTRLSGWLLVGLFLGVSHSMLLYDGKEYRGKEIAALMARNLSREEVARVNVTWLLWSEVRNLDERFLSLMSDTQAQAIHHLRDQHMAEYEAALLLSRFDQRGKILDADEVPDTTQKVAPAAAQKEAAEPSVPRTPLSSSSKSNRVASILNSEGLEKGLAEENSFYLFGVEKPKKTEVSYLNEDFGLGYPGYMPLSNSVSDYFGYSSDPIQEDYFSFDPTYSSSLSSTTTTTTPRYSSTTTTTTPGYSSTTTTTTPTNTTAPTSSTTISTLPDGEQATECVPPKKRRFVQIVISDDEGESKVAPPKKRKAQRKKKVITVIDDGSYARKRQPMEPQEVSDSESFEEEMEANLKSICRTKPVPVDEVEIKVEIKREGTKEEASHQTHKKVSHKVKKVVKESESWEDSEESGESPSSDDTWSPKKKQIKTEKKKHVVKKGKKLSAEEKRRVKREKRRGIERALEEKRKFFLELKKEKSQKKIKEEHVKEESADKKKDAPPILPFTKSRLTVKQRELAGEKNKDYKPKHKPHTINKEGKMVRPNDVFERANGELQGLFELSEEEMGIYQEAVEMMRLYQPISLRGEMGLLKRVIHNISDAIKPFYVYVSSGLPSKEESKALLLQYLTKFQEIMEENQEEYNHLMAYEFHLSESESE